MKKSRLTLTVIITIFILLVTGCTRPPIVSEETAQLREQLLELKSENESLMQEVTVLQETLQTPMPQPPLSLIDTALQVVSYLDAKDMQALSNAVHPTVGVRLSPYSYVDMQNHLSFAAQDIPTLLDDSQALTWGSYDGSGDPITLNFSDYFERFVYDKEYLNPHIIGINTLVGTGNTLVNLETAYPTASFVEFHFTGSDPQFAGMDWRSLILVFESLSGEWSLVGIVHNEWTT